MAAAGKFQRSRLFGTERRTERRGQRRLAKVLDHHQAAVVTVRLSVEQPFPVRRKANAVGAYRLLRSNPRSSTLLGAESVEAGPAASARLEKGGHAGVEQINAIRQYPKTAALEFQRQQFLGAAFGWSTPEFPVADALQVSRRSHRRSSNRRLPLQLLVHVQQHAQVRLRFRFLARRVEQDCRPLPVRLYVESGTGPSVGQQS